MKKVLKEKTGKLKFLLAAVVLFSPNFSKAEDIKMQYLRLKYIQAVGAKLPVKHIRRIKHEIIRQKRKNLIRKVKKIWFPADKKSATRVASY